MLALLLSSQYIVGGRLAASLLEARARQDTAAKISKAMMR
jgi:hypothetical protein